jgi:hypothetical protein
MPGDNDLGSIILRERPLIIREAIVGGRRLTKSLYSQLPILETLLPVEEVETRIVAWLNIHWKDCTSHLYDYMVDGDVGTDHRHVLLASKDAPMQGTIWSPGRGPIHIYEKESRTALLALMARRRLKGHEVKIQNSSIKVDHRGHRLVFHLVEDERRALNWVNQPQLFDLSVPLAEESELIAEVEKEIHTTEEFRASIAAQWQLVKTETPQIVL